MGFRRTADGTTSRIAAVLGSAVLCVALSFAGAPAASAAGTGVWEIEHFVRYESANHTSIDVATGDSFRYIVNYTCTNDSCAGATLTIPFPSGYTVGTPTYNPAHLTGLVRTDNVLVFTIADGIAPGTTGQIDVQATVPGFTTPDGTTYAQAATIATPGQPDAVSATVSVTAHAASNTPVTVTRVAGGATDDITKYTISACNSSTGAPLTGGLAVLDGSTLTVQLPPGAVVEVAAGGTVSGSPPSIAWTLPAYGGFGCIHEEIAVSYPGSDPANTLGAGKNVQADWDRTLHGQSAAMSSGSTTHALTAPTAAVASVLSQLAPYNYGGAPVAKVDYGTSAVYTATIGNTGIGTLTTTDVVIAVPPALLVNAIAATNPGHDAGTVFVTTTCGPDRTPGTSDDGEEEPFATVAARGSISAASTTVAWPNGSPPLGAACFITGARFRIASLWPGEGDNALAVHAEPVNPDRHGTPTAHGDDLETAMTVSGTNTAGTAADSHSVQTEINGPPPTDPRTYVTVRNIGPGLLGAGVFQGNASLTTIVSNQPLGDPVMAVLLPPGIDLVSWSGNDLGQGTPIPTLTQTPNYDGNGWTLLTWRFPSGTALPAIGAAYVVDYTVERTEFAYGVVNMPGYVHTADADTQMVCTENYFGSQPDTFDVDGDGDTAEHGCRWDADMSITASASAGVVTKIKGSFDSGYVAGPATGQTAPGSADSYRVELKNTGTTELDQVVMVEKLPRPGDTRTISAATRNATTRTFPVVLRGAPTVPTLPLGATLSWSDVTGACQPELGYNPSGCHDPRWHSWSTDPPAAFADVLMVKVEFGANVLKPGVTWSVDLPVTTPTTGATEPERADFNPDPFTVPNETAVNTIAFRAQRKDISTALAATEPPGVTLEVPGVAGPVGPAPDPVPITTLGSGTAPHTTTVTPPPSGVVELLDDGTPVDELVVPGVGTYRVVPATGVMTFEPVLGYTGTAAPVAYRVVDAYGQSGASTWTATVDLPAPPAAPAITSTGPVRTPQTATVTVPAGGTVRLLDGATKVSAVTVPGVGTSTIDPSTGEITFTPVDSFHGPAPAVGYVVTDAYGQDADGTYTPTVSLGALTASPVTTTGVGTAVQTVTIPVPVHEGAVHLLHDGHRVDTVVIPGEGTYTVDPATGAVTFFPELGFWGAGTTLAYERSDGFGQTATSTYTAAVTKPAPPTAPSATSASSTEQPRAPQTVTIPVPPDTTITLVDEEGNEVTTVTVSGVGTFVLDPTTGVITFTPLDGFDGPSATVAVRFTDRYGQASTGAYTATIAARPVGPVPVGTETPTAAPGTTPGSPTGEAPAAATPTGAASAFALTGGSLALARIGGGLVLVGALLSIRRRRNAALGR